MFSKPLKPSKITLQREYKNARNWNIFNFETLRWQLFNGFEMSIRL
jgi:hypothetical protein